MESLKKPKKSEDSEKKAGKRKNREDEGEEENRKKQRKRMEEEDQEWKLRMERKVDELTDVGRFVMMNMGSVLKAVEGLKKEVAEWSEVVKKTEIGFRKEVEDRDADGEEDDEDEDEEEKKDGLDWEESEKDAEDVAGEVVG